MSDEGDRESQNAFRAYAAISTVLGLVLISAALLALGVLPAWGDAIAGGYLWTLGIFLFLGFSLADWAHRSGPAIERRQRLDPRLRALRFQVREERALEAPEPATDQEIRWNPIALWVGRFCILGTLVALALSGWVVLAGLYGCIVLIGLTAANDSKGKPKDEAESPRSSARWLIGRTNRTLLSPLAFVGRLLATFVAVTFWLVIGAICWLWELCFGPGIAHALLESFERPDGLIYFVYSEPHQRDHFLGGDGPLQPLLDQVIARDWRADLRPMWEALDWRGYRNSPECRLLDHFGIRRMRDHLPFVAVVSPLSGIQAFKANKAYRSRRRDQGAALRKLEERIEKAANDAFDIAAT